MPDFDLRDGRTGGNMVNVFLSKSGHPSLLRHGHREHQATYGKMYGSDRHKRVVPYRS